MQWFLLECGHYGTREDLAPMENKEKATFYYCRTCSDLVRKAVVRRVVKPVVR